MYNEERKLRYIEENKNRNLELEKVITKHFNTTAPYEEELEKDLCEFTSTEAVAFYKQRGSSSLETLMMVNSYSKTYTDWCLSHGYVKDMQNHFTELTYDLLHKECTNSWIKDKQIFTRDEVIKICDRLSNPSDKFMVLALFEGICGQSVCDISNVSLENLKGNVLTTYSNKQITISDTLIKYLCDACNEYEYMPYAGPGVREHYYYDMHDPRAIKRMYNSNKEETDCAWRHRIGAKLRRVNEKLNIDLGTKSLLYSGAIDYIRELCKKEPDKDVARIILDHKDDIANKYINIASTKRFLLKYGEYLGV